jgi:hypothetical protein
VTGYKNCVETCLLRTFMWHAWHRVLPKTGNMSVFRSFRPRIVGVT